MIQRFLAKFNDGSFVYQYFLIFRYAISFICSIIIVRSGLTTADIGTYEWLLFLIHTGTFFFHNSILTYFMSIYGKASVSEKPRIISGVFTSVLLLACILMAFIGLGIYGFDQMPFFLQLKPFFPYIVAYSIVMSPLALVEGTYFLLGLEKVLLRYIHFSQLGIVIGFLGVAIVQPSIQNFLLFMILWGAIRLLYFCRTIDCSDAFNFDVKFAVTLMLTFTPVFVNQLLSQTMEMADGWMVKYFFDDSTFAIFRYGARELPLSSFLFSGISLTYIYTLQTNGYDLSNLRTRINKLMGYVFPIGILSMVLSPFLFSFFYSPDFRNSALVFNVYLLILVSRVLLPQTILMAKNQFNVILYSTIFEIIINISLSLWWVHLWGIMGLTLATAVAYFIQKIILIIYNTRINHIHITDIIDLRRYTMWSMGLIVMFAISYFYIL